MNTEMKLKTGKMNTIDCGNGLRVHVYDTGDAIADQVIFLEKAGKAVSLELPCFEDSIAAVSQWLADSNIDLVAKLVAYHGAGASFRPDVKVLTTASASAYNTDGQGKQLVDGFAKAFGDAFDSSMPGSPEIIGAGRHKIAGIEFDIVPNEDAFEVEIPGARAVYIHMLGHDCHSIVAGPAHADAIIASLKGYLDRGFQLFLSSHYASESRQDVETKIAYLEGLKDIASRCSSAEEFKAEVGKTYPGYSGANYLDMTAGFFFH